MSVSVRFFTVGLLTSIMMAAAASVPPAAQGGDESSTPPAETAGAAGVSSGMTADRDESAIETARDRSERAATVLREMMASPDYAIPDYLLARAHGIAVIPHVVKGAFGIGGQGGMGLILARNGADDWTAPLFVTVGGLSWGAQIGVEATDMVLVFANQTGLEDLARSKVELGVDVSIAAGPLGRNAQAGTNITLESAIYSYSRSKGLFAGVAINGAVLQIDNDEDEAVYGEPVDALAVLDGRTVLEAPPAVQPFLDTVREVTPPAEPVPAD